MRSSPPWRRSSTTRSDRARWCARPGRDRAAVRRGDRDPRCGDRAGRRGPAHRARRSAGGDRPGGERSGIAPWRPASAQVGPGPSAPTDDIERWQAHLAVVERVEDGLRQIKIAIGDSALAADAEPPATSGPCTRSPLADRRRRCSPMRSSPGSGCPRRPTSRRAAPVAGGTAMVDLVVGCRPGAGRVSSGSGVGHAADVTWATGSGRRTGVGCGSAANGRNSRERRSPSRSKRERSEPVDARQVGRLARIGLEVEERGRCGPGSRRGR